MDVDQIREDLIVEQDDLDAIVAPLPADAWATPTPAEGWTITDQVGHLTYFDLAAATAIRRPEAFKEMGEQLWTATPEGSEAVDALTLDSYRAMTPKQLVAAWRAGRIELAGAAGMLSDATRVAWYGPEMGAKSFLSARLMETWAHGQDIVDALGVDRKPSDRLRHVARLGFNTRGWSYINRGENPPTEPVKVELDAPDGDRWTFGPNDADEGVSGSALDFCLVVTQRRHLDDTDLVATPLAREWLLKAQAFAGPPTIGPDAGART